MEPETDDLHHQQPTDSNAPTRSLKKLKHQENVDSALSPNQPDTDMQEPPTSAWGHRSFADTLQGLPAPLQLYLGEDDEREFDEFEELCSSSETEAGKSGSLSPVVPISPEKYHSLFKPW